MSQLETAIIHFLANEFQTQPESIIPDTDFFLDFDLDQDKFQDLITRMQDALDFILPEEKISEIRTLSDLFESLTAEESPSHEPL